MIIQKLDLPAATASKTALLIDERATDKQLSDLGHTLAQIEGSRSWWLGDYGIALQARKRKQLCALLPDSAPEEIDTKGLHYIAEKAEELGIDEGSWRNYVVVARYFKPSHRSDSLSFAHHRVTIEAFGTQSDPKKAIAWLLKAEEANWSVSQLRHQINLSLATAKPPTLPPESNPFAPLDEADQWAAHCPPPADAEQARLLLTRLASLCKYIDALRQAAQFPQ